MNTLLITPAQVNALAFRGELQESYISRSSILAAQERHVLPSFAECYDMLTGSIEPYPDFVADYLQPALAQFVKLDIMPSISAITGSRGVMQFDGIESTRSATDVSLERLIKATRRDARTLLRRAVRRAVELGIIKAERRKTIL